MKPISGSQNLTINYRVDIITRSRRSFTDVPSMWNCFADRFTKALNKFVPISKPRKYKNIFMTREAFNLRKNKNIVCGKNTVHQDHLLIIFPIYRLAMH